MSAALQEYRDQIRAERHRHSMEVRNNSSYAVWRRNREAYHKIDPFHARVVDKLVEDETPIAGEFYQIFRVLRENEVDWRTGK